MQRTCVEWKEKGGRGKKQGERHQEERRKKGRSHRLGGGEKTERLKKVAGRTNKNGEWGGGRKTGAHRETGSGPRQVFGRGKGKREDHWPESGHL